MRIGPVELPALAVPRLGLAAFRRRIVFHAVFLALGLATLGLALVLLTEEKQRSHQRYAQGFKQTLAQVVAQLRHPAGQLALLNPGHGRAAQSAKAASTPSAGVAPQIATAAPPPSAGVAPLVLPFSALDFDDPNKAQQAVEMSGCALRYPDGAALCVAVGSNAYAGGFIYLVGQLRSGHLVARERGGLALQDVHRARVSLQVGGARLQWTAPFELLDSAPGGALRGRLTGFADSGDGLDARAKPVRDFRGWLWQEGPCLPDAASAAAARLATDVTGAADCQRRTLVSIRLPVEAWREALFQRPAPAWPPADLQQVRLRLQLLTPGGAPPLFDSDSAGALPAFALDDLRANLTPGETLVIEAQRAAATAQPGPALHTIATLRATPDTEADVGSTPWLVRLIRHLPAPDTPVLLQASDQVVTPLARYQITLRGDLRGIDRSLGVTAARLSWFVGAMLAAIALAWLIIELGLVRRVAVLTRRAAAVSYNMQDARIDQRIGELDVSDLRGNDELGILAGSLSDLLQRAKDNARREHIRAEQERDMWHAVGHEIMSPLQSLMVLHGDAADASHRYVQRMQQAVRVLYGTASPGEAIESATLQVGTLDVVEFTRHLCENAHFAGLDQVVFGGGVADAADEPIRVRADEYSLEDAVTHVLRNADRYRLPGTPITLTLQADEAGAQLHIHNTGPAVAPDRLEQIFEYGVSDQAAAGGGEHRGQGLFVARTYMAKMGGTISVRNVAGGVVFTLSLQRAG